jgi:acetamidase/formamidase
MIRVTPERRTLHGHFSRDLPPALEVASGYTVRFTTLMTHRSCRAADGAIAAVMAG